MLTHINAHTQNFLDYLEQDCPYISKHYKKPTDEQFEKLCGTYGEDKVRDMCLQIENRADLRKKYTDLYRTLTNWLKREYNGKEDINNGLYRGDNARFMQQAIPYIADAENWTMPKGDDFV